MNWVKKISLSLFIFVLFLELLLSCSTHRGIKKTEKKAQHPRDAEALAATHPIRLKLTEGAETVLGKTELVVRGKRFNMDCTGVILAIYYYAGIDLAEDFHRYRGNGVTKLYLSLESEDLLYNTSNPVPGDIILWDNTWDRNGDGQWNDPLTHTGMVFHASEDGNIKYVHLNYSKGIIFESMNLQDPEIQQKLVKGEMVIINSPMRMKQKGKLHPDRWLSSHLYKIFGMGYLLSP